jgi:hypothetical protein
MQVSFGMSNGIEVEKTPFGARDSSESDTQSRARGAHHGAALNLLNIMRPGITKDAWDDFLLSRGAWANGGNSAYMHVSPQEILRVALAFATERESGWVPVDDEEVEVAIAEAIAATDPKTDYCETGVPVLKYLKQHGWTVMQSKRDADAITKALSSIVHGAHE